MSGVISHQYGISDQCPQPACLERHSRVLGQSPCLDKGGPRLATRPTQRPWSFSSGGTKREALSVKGTRFRHMNMSPKMVGFSLNDQRVEGWTISYD